MFRNGLLKYFTRRWNFLRRYLGPHKTTNPWIDRLLRVYGFQNFWVDDEAIYGGFENDAEPVAICRVVDYRLSTGKISTAYFPREASSCTLSELYGDFSDLEEDDPPEESPPFRSLQNYGRKQTVAIDVDSRQITV
ncbi:hypothetical protein QR680_017716 [Steinernema hermaphroditum]|uniref:Uncharacterized protein n=1 Tax=Steinernema hermaphroditum TaxID=289476 RepID=A0AA39HFK7_9BILA|nr:hypothetical protein QR680_017716 [Steinernema hermaphroditum]